MKLKKSSDSQLPLASGLHLAVVSLKGPSTSHFAP